MQRDKIAECKRAGVSHREISNYFKDFPGPIIPKENTPGPSKLGEAKAAPPEPVDD